MKQQTLIKLSSPGFEYTGSEDAVREKLYSHICIQCRREDNITENSDVGDMLATPCGCEFMIEDTEQ